jgi:hypothetical protein
VKVLDTMITKLRCRYELSITQTQYDCSASCCSRYRVVLTNPESCVMADIPIMHRTDLRKAGKALIQAADELGK